MSKALPSGWSYATLSDVANIDPESLKSSTDSEFSFRYVDIASVSTGIIQKPSEYIKFRDAPSRARRMLRTGDVLMSTVRPNLKAFAYFNFEENDCVASTGFAVLRPKNGNSGRFIFNTILSDSVSRQIEALVVGSNYPAINSSEVKNLEILSPPLPEQQKIAAILTSVDDVIESTQAQINKLKDLKSGMMQELLTKGIGHTEFKDSPVGRIPKAWEVLELSAISSVIDSLHSTPSFSLSGYPMVRVTDIKSGKLSLRNTVKVEESTYFEFIKKYKPSKNDLVMSRVGSYGVCSYVDTDENFCIGQNTIVIHPNKIDTKFLYYSIHSLATQSQIENEVAGSGYKSLSLASIRALNIVVPPLSEQLRLSGILWSIDTKLESLQSKIALQQHIKKALMQDLLTGKVRVNVN